MKRLFSSYASKHSQGKRGNAYSVAPFCYPGKKTNGGAALPPIAGKGGSEELDAMFCELSIYAAFMGYVIMALENLDYKDEQIWQVIAEMKELCDWVSPEEAGEHYSKGPF